MATGGYDYLDEVEASTRRRQLCTPDKLVARLMFCRRTHQEECKALIGQATLAGDFGRQQWLRMVARQARDLQFQGDAWISHNIYWVERRRPIAVPTVTGPSVDYRLGIDPSVERHRFQEGGTKDTSCNLGSTPAVAKEREMVVDTGSPGISLFAADSEFNEVVEDQRPPAGTGEPFGSPGFLSGAGAGGRGEVECGNWWEWNWWEWNCGGFASPGVIRREGGQAHG